MSISELPPRSVDVDRDGLRDGINNDPPRDLAERYCEVPFETAQIHSEGQLYLCCPTWLPTPVGRVDGGELRAAFNSTMAREIRRSILDGSFAYCNKLVCPRIQTGQLPLRREVERERDRRIIAERTVGGLDPINLSLCYDESCNLSCPSCRTGLLFDGEGPEYEKKQRIQQEIVDYAFGAPHDRALMVTITGSGDPFGSKLFRELLFSLDGARYPNLRIRLHTNGLGFNRQAWDRMARIHRNLADVMVSVDAGNEADYTVTRRGGNWRALLENLELLGAKRREGALASLILLFVVQRDNYRGIPDYVRLAKQIGADACSMAPLLDWGTWPREEFLARTVWNQKHPEFDQFLRVMADPILSDPIVRLDRVSGYRRTALERFRTAP